VPSLPLSYKWFEMYEVVFLPLFTTTCCKYSSWRVNGMVQAVSCKWNMTGEVFMPQIMLNTNILLPCAVISFMSFYGTRTACKHQSHWSGSPIYACPGRKRVNTQSFFYPTTVVCHFCRYSAMCVVEWSVVIQ
jgi:hypothetical protein